MHACMHTYIHTYIYIYIYQFTRSPPLAPLAEQPWVARFFFPRDRDVGRDRIKDRIIKTSLDLHKSDRSPDHRVCASASPTTATSIRSNTSDERYSPRSKLGEILNGISPRGGGFLDGIVIERSCSKQTNKVPLGRAKSSIRSCFRFRTARTSRIPSRASHNIVRVVGRDLSWGRRRLGFRMPRTTRFGSSKTSSSFSSLPKEHVVVTARIVRRSKIDVSRSGCGTTLERLSSLLSQVKDRLIIVSGGNRPCIRGIASWIAMGRRAGPELTPAKNGTCRIVDRRQCRGESAGYWPSVRAADDRPRSSPPSHFRRSSSPCKDHSRHRGDRALPVCPLQELLGRPDRGPIWADWP